ncbi:MAG: hypothetical protein HYU75_25550, partial [Betaproteobacteria bacterium]|nr:hypothetical protein [Betaproteobacteria bacterium]
MDAQGLLRDISDYCRRAGVSLSAFGRLAVNDGKFVGRLRDGGRITTVTLDRVRSYIASHPLPEIAGRRPLLVAADLRESAASAGGERAEPPGAGVRNFRFYDNRQKYLLFVTTCSEKWVVADRVAMELANIHPRPPAVRVFDAGVGDGTVLTRAMRAMH